MRAQEAPPAARREVADRAAEERDDPRARRARGTWSRWRSKSPTMPCTRSPGNSSTSSSAHARTIALGDVERHVARRSVPASCMALSSSARLGRRARPELDELGRAGQRGDLGRSALEDRPLGARRVVLGQLADLVEQLGAARVVEVLGRQLLERPGEAVEDVVGERPLVARGRGTTRTSMRRGSRIGSIRCSVLRVTGQPHAGEDLPALREVPVAERARSRRAGAVAQEPPRRTR